MSDNVVTLPPTNADPTATAWTETITVTRNLEVGIERMPDGLYRVFRKMHKREDAIVCPSAETAAAMLTHVYFDLRMSTVGDNIVGTEMDAALFEIEEVLRWMGVFSKILTAADFPPADEVAGLRRRQ